MHSPLLARNEESIRFKTVAGHGKLSSRSARREAGQHIVSKGEAEQEIVSTIPRRVVRQEIVSTISRRVAGKLRGNTNEDEQVRITS